MVAALKVDPVVGEDPLTVTLDASISSLYDEEDEIVYFNWDFDDGQTMQNVSQGKVDHIYRYDVAKERGDFYPTVTVKTRK
ncbi:MAG: PKD domain-containing protein [Candidatus Peribacteria bacterium]|nr:MAG: PKD domain-containing protein [Candidatus Peribacteria bacterium]